MTIRIVPLTMPKWGIEMQQGTVTEWHVAVGEKVDKGAALLAVETDKIVNEVEAPAGGVLRRILAESGAIENVGALLAVLAEPAVTEDEISSFISDFKPVDARFERDDEPATDIAGAPPLPAEATPADGEARVSPIARRIAERLGVDLNAVKGTGRNGRVSKEDVEAFAARAPAPSTAVGGGPTRIKLTPMRSAIAKRLLDSTQGIPHYRVSMDVQFSALARAQGFSATTGRRGLGQ